MQRCFFILFIVSVLFQGSSNLAYSVSNDIGNLEGEQSTEKSELEQMRQQLKQLKETTNEAISAYNQLDTSPLKKGLQEFHLFCRSASHEMSPGKTIECLTYNGLLPGPTLRVKEGQLVRVIVHNQLEQNTSFHLHGMVLPDSVDGLPSAKGGLIKPGQTYAYQFIAKSVGTYWYHPQIMHSEQKVKGMYGAFIVEPDPLSKTVDEDIVLILGEAAGDKIQAASNTSIASKPNVVKTVSKTSYLVNGKTAPAIPAIEVRPNSRVRLRIINAGQHNVPLHITGHKFEVISLNGAPYTEHAFIDTINCGVSDRLDLEFTADNPGLWCLGSELMEQSTVNGQFPGGIACLIRYIE